MTRFKSRSRTAMQVWAMASIAGLCFCLSTFVYPLICLNMQLSAKSRPSFRDLERMLTEIFFGSLSILCVAVRPESVVRRSRRRAHGSFQLTEGLQCDEFSLAVY